MTFAEEGSKTRLTVHAQVVKTTVAAAPHLKGQEEGWSQSLRAILPHFRKSKSGLIINVSSRAADTNPIFDGLRGRGKPSAEEVAQVIYAAATVGRKGLASLFCWGGYRQVKAKRAMSDEECVGFMKSWFLAKPS